jgi:C4-type Zn-finger protein
LNPKRAKALTKETRSTKEKELIKMIKCPNCGLSNPVELTDRDTPYKEEIVNEYLCEECGCWFSVTFKATEIKVLDK